MDSGEGIPLLLAESNSSWKVQPLIVELSAPLGSGFKPSSSITQTTNRLRIVYFFPYLDFDKIHKSKDLEYPCSLQAGTPQAGLDIAPIIIIIIVIIIVIIIIIIIIIIVIIII